jgi:hypothetical protein
MKISVVFNIAAMLFISAFAFGSENECKKNPSVMYSCTVTIKDTNRTYGPYLGEGYTKLAAKYHVLWSCINSAGPGESACRAAIPTCEQGVGYTE